ncbi:hypothetical protein ABZW96_09155 [Nocardia sp. NPDC004168]|uniref:hypothetical protein n=1 Tax=Nocardia TaxID=1817 RepID=UPI00031904BF|nr:hypothetical protein [Nocardia araoensis]
MVKEFAQDPHELRRLGNANRAASAPAYERADRDPDFAAGEIERIFGKAANAYKVFTQKYVTESSNGYTALGDGRYATGDHSTTAGDTFEISDIDGGAYVRRTNPNV